MAKVFDVDKFLKNKSLIIKLGDKEFEVTDIPASFQKKVNKAKKEEDIEIIQDMLCEILGCSKEDLEPYGIRAYNAILENICDCFFPESSPKKVSKS